MMKTSSGDILLSAATDSSADKLAATVLLGLAIIVAGAALGAAAARRLGQPAVVGEMIAGLLIGTSLFGLAPHALPQMLFPEQVRSVLSVIAQVGLVLFMFGVGYETDPRLLRRTGPAAATIGVGSVIIPLGLGVAVAFGLHPWHDHIGSQHVATLPFVLFLGAALSITAFPVLARILTEQGARGTPLGDCVLAAAALADLLAWGLLAAVTSIATGSGATNIIRMLVGVAVIGLALVVLRLLLTRLFRSRLCRNHADTAPFLILVVCTFLAAWASSWIGLHAVFGAFAFGVSVPRQALRAASPRAALRVEEVSLLFVPVFFIITGLSVDLASFDGRALLELGGLLVVACLSKFAGAAGAARIAGLDVRTSSAVGVLMNARGLTELIVVHIGVSLHVLNATLASELIVMALVTTMITGPLFRRVYPTQQLAATRSAVAPVGVGSGGARPG